MSSVLAVGVKVEVHVIESPLSATADMVPDAILRSPLAKPATASENTIVTSEVSPAFSAVSAKEMLLTVGATVSTL